MRKQLIIYSFTVFTHVRFGKNLNLIGSLLVKEQRKLEFKTILVGVTDTKCSLFNYLIAHFRVAACLSFKVSPGAQPFKWK